MSDVRNNEINAATLPVSMFNHIPAGFVVGADRASPSHRVSHLYQGTFEQPGLPMCRHGYNRDNGETYSIWRGNVVNGLCKTCVKRAKKKLEGVEPKQKSEPK